MAARIYDLKMADVIREITSKRYQLYPDSVSIFRSFPRALPDGIESLQLNTPMSRDMWSRLAELMAGRPEVELRVYGGTDNLDFLEFFPSLRKLQADCLLELRSFDGLRFSDGSLHSLALGSTLHKPSIKPVLQLKDSLTNFHVEGPVKDAGLIGQLTELQVLSLRSISLPNLLCLLDMPQLISLDLKLGGTNNLEGLSQLQQLQRLEIWMVRGLEDITNIGALENLRDLHLESQKRVEYLPSFKEMLALRSLTLWNMKGINNLKPLVGASNLEQLRLIDMPHLDLDQLRPLLELPMLERATIGLGSVRRNEAANQLLPLPSAGKAAYIDTDSEGRAYWRDR